MLNKGGVKMDYETLREAIEAVEKIVEEIEDGDIMNERITLEDEIDELNDEKLSKLFEEADAELDRAREKFENLLNILNKKVSC